MDKEQSISVLWRRLLDINRQLKITLNGMNCKSGVSNTSMAIIFQLEHQAQMKMNDIADYLCITLGAATSLVDKLEELKWVRRLRSQEDRRIIYVELTDEGKLKLRAMREEFIAQAKIIFSSLPKERIGQMGDQLEELVQYMHEYNQLTELHNHD